jgi:hypothetical protein
MVAVAKTHQTGGGHDKVAMVASGGYVLAMAGVPGGWRRGGGGPVALENEGGGEAGFKRGRNGGTGRAH